METIYSFFEWLSSGFGYIVDFFKALPSAFSDLFSYIQLYVVKLRIYMQIEFIKLSYRTAQLLLQEIGFNDALAAAFNALPSELRYYAFKFQIPQALSIVANFISTAFVMRFSR